MQMNLMRSSGYYAVVLTDETQTCAFIKYFLYHLITINVNNHLYHIKIEKDVIKSSYV